jgi:hypothetical protein
MKQSGPVLALIVIAQIWAAHALAFFAHEYGHSVVAWALGWKSNPLLLNFGDLSWPNLLAMLKIDERVDYAPIFASGHGAQAALIAAAGVLANALLYPVSVAAFLKTRAQRRPTLALFFFWLAAMCVGNFIDYVPTRTFSPVGDMHTLERGLGVSPMVVLLVLGLPFLAGGAHFFGRLLPQARRTLLPERRAGQAWLVGISTFIIFVFFPAAGFETGTGSIARVIAVACIVAVFPLATLLCWPRRATAVEGDGPTQTSP